MNAIDRFKDGEKWCYRDPKEEEFVGTMWLYGIHLPSIDDFIEGLQKKVDGKHILDDKPVQLSDDKRAELLNERRQALNEYIAGEIERSKEWATALHNSCRDAGMILMSLPLAKKSVRITKIRRAEGEKYGKKGGFKGGRRSKKPFNIKLKEMYDKHIKDCGTAREARARLVKELHHEKHVSPRTVRNWLRGAGI